MQKFFLNNLINKNISFFSINFTKFLTKKEKSILLILKKEFKNRYIEIEKNLLLKNGIYSDMEELEINIFNDLYKLREKNIIISYKENRKFSSPFEIHSFFLKLIKELNSKNININFEVFSIKFLTKIYFLKEGKELYYNEKNYSFYLEYKLHEKSTIIIKKYILEN